MSMAALIMAVYLFARGRKELGSLRVRDLAVCALSGVFLGLHFMAYNRSLGLTGITAAVTLVDTEMFFVAAGMFIAVRERTSPASLAGMAAAFVGSVIIAAADGGSAASLRGDLWALSGAVFMAVYTIIGRLERGHVSTGVYTFIVYLSAAVTALAAALLSGTRLFGYGLPAYAAGFGLAVVCTLMGHSIFSWGLGYEKAAYISVLKLLEPVFASVLGVLLLHEYPRLQTALGRLVVIAGVAWCSIQSAGEKKNGQKKTDSAR